jgi:hypothetical protein
MARSGVSRRLAALSLVLLVGGALRAASLREPIDRADNLWREADLAGIARNFEREGMDLLYPRIDWRGDGPGYVEMEFPIYPWAMAWIGRTTGLDVVLVGRLLALVFSLLTLLTFVGLARHLLPESGALAAIAFFALAPLAVEVGHLLLADGLMLWCYVAAVYAFLLWLDGGTWVAFACAAVATSAAILAKEPAAHIGLLFACLLLQRSGWRVLREPRVWLFAALVLVPPALWYRHAYGLWTTYGNSIGISNSHHWVGLDLFTNPRFVGGLGRSELLRVWTPPAVVVMGLAILWVGWSRATVVGCLWLAVLAVYYVAAVRTTYGIWGIYYHVVSVPPVALLVGAGVEAIGSALATAQIGSRRRRMARIGLTCLVLTFVYEVALIGLEIAHRRPDALHACARQFRPHLQGEGLLVASGGICRLPTGQPAAGNKPYMFYWLDRKGFDMCEDSQSIEELGALARRGARWFVAEKAALRAAPGLEAELRRQVPLLAECDAALLFRLDGT